MSLDLLTRLMTDSNRTPLLGYRTRMSPDSHRLFLLRVAGGIHPNSN
jgi:hypothetical protein